MADRILYLCDGSKCESSENCYINGGPCMHTEDYTHSIKRNKGVDFPQTMMIRVIDVLIEVLVHDSDKKILMGGR